jgi:hypothetical protein
MTRTRLRSSILLLLAAGLVTGCSKASTKQLGKAGYSDSESTSQPSSVAAFPIALRPMILPQLKPQKVRIKVFEHRLTSSPAAGETREELYLDLHATLQATGNNSDGAVPASLKINRICLTMNSSGPSRPQLSYDSQTDKPNNGNPLADLMATVADAKLSLRVSREGRLIELHGLDAKWRAANIIMAPPSLFTAQWMFRDAGMAELVSEGLFPSVPDRPVDMGDEWEFDVPLNIPLVARLTSHVRCAVLSSENDRTDALKTVGISGGGSVQPANLADSDVAPAIQPRVQTTSGHGIKLLIDPRTGSFSLTSGGRVEVELTLKPPAGDERLQMTISRRRSLQTERSRIEW